VFAERCESGHSSTPWRLHQNALDSLNGGTASERALKIAGFGEAAQHDVDRVVHPRRRVDVADGHLPRGQGACIAIRLIPRGETDARTWIG
jgi:hypothetical protein